MKQKNLINFSFMVCLAFLLFGCGSPCSTEANEKASKIIDLGLKDNQNRQMYSCGFVTNLEEYNLEMYGYDDNEIEQIMKNIHQVSKIPDVNMKIYIYKTPFYLKESKHENISYGKVVKPDEKPVLTIKIDNKGK